MAGSSSNWGFPETMGTFLGAPIVRIMVYWGPPFLGNYQIYLEFKLLSLSVPRFGHAGTHFTVTRWLVAGKRVGRVPTSQNPELSLSFCKGGASWGCKVVFL